MNLEKVVKRKEVIEMKSCYECQHCTWRTGTEIEFGVVVPECGCDCSLIGKEINDGYSDIDNDSVCERFKEKRIEETTEEESETAFF